MFKKHIPWNKGGEIGWLLELQNLESDSSNLEIYSVASRKPVQIRKNGRDVANTRFFSNDPGKCISAKDSGGLDLGLKKSNGFRLGWIEVKTIVQEPVVDPLPARLKDSSLSKNSFRKLLKTFFLDR